MTLPACVGPYHPAVRNHTLALSLLVALAIVLTPLGFVLTADAAPRGYGRVDRHNAVARERGSADLGLPAEASRARVWFAEAEVANQAGAAGVTWPAGRTPDQVYVREVHGRAIGPWRLVGAEESPNASEPGNGTGGTSAYVIAGADRVQVAVVSAQPIEATLSVFAATATGPATIQAAAASTEAWSNPSIASRSSWGADESLVRYAYTYAKVTGAMIHHTAGTNTYTQADVPAILRSIQAYHVNGRGWNDIAYNFLIDKFGRAYEGRGGGVTKAVQGGHAYGVTNARTTGVSLIGNFETATPPAAMLDTLERVIAWKFALHKVDPYGTTYGSGGQDGGSTFLNAISGHRDENATDCPGKYVYSQMATIRAKVASYVPLYSGTTPSTPTPTPPTTTPPATPAASRNVARDAGVKATASSEDTSAGSTAYKAIDGVISGYPTDETKEWSSSGEGANAWITLTFPSPVRLDRVVLHDRINLTDRVLGGKLTFSDGTTVTVGKLDNAGAPLSVTFTARTVTSVRFTVTSASKNTENSGLAEFQAWGR